MASVAVIALIFATCLLGSFVLAVQPGEPQRLEAFIASYDGVELTDPFEKLVRQSDGQAFAALARDPLLQHPEEFPTPEEFAYRAQRIFLPWLAWLGSGGRNSAVAPALAVLELVGAVTAVTGTARLMVARGVDARWALLVLAMPGALASFDYFGPELLVTGLLAHGLAEWERTPQQRLRTTGLLSAAALGRETALLVPFTLLVRRRFSTAPQLAALVAPAAALAIWYGVIRWRIGHWPTEAGDGRLTLPFVGLAEALVDGAISSPLVLLNLALLAGAGVVAYRRRHDRLAEQVAGHLAFATLLGPLVWEGWQFSSRVLLPAYAFGLVLAVSPARSAASANGGSSLPPRTRRLGRGSPEVAEVPPSG